MAGVAATAGAVLAGLGSPASASSTAADHNGPQGGGGTHIASVAAQALPPITGPQVLANANEWFIAANNPPYNQAGYWRNRDFYAGDGRGDNPRPGGNPPAWREDCSGFMAHAWSQVDSNGGFTTFTMGAYSKPISWSELQPGDALLFDGVRLGADIVDHVGLFLGWDTPNTYSIMDESHPGSGTVVQHNIPLGIDGFWQYGQPIRANSFIPGTGHASTSESVRGGYRLSGADGSLFAFNATFAGSAGGMSLNRPVVGMATSPDGAGYYQVASDGGVFAFGDARFAGSTGSERLNQPIVGMAVDPATGGYWLVASDGGVFSFNAPFFGSTGSIRLNRPVVGIAATPDGGGYWLVASDGGVFSFGSARFAGSTGSVGLNQPIVGMTADPATGGYWLVASDGGIFSFNAPFFGSTGSMRLNRPVIAMASTRDGSGYWLVASDGGIFSFNAPFLGSAGGAALNAPIVAMGLGST